ncbi:MAG: hypothetical protein E6248_00495 [Clostridium sp.]|uniref:hypothetical protein n=1 Tax=Clostridium sp. TaxID=1506 RepID=UPI00291419B4|nr:hypothetical protein [Clostridium sp.]MDU5108895.1 hypothetical protein [Clostridium sp.]
MITELVKELNKIFNNKVYPTNAPEGEKPPYLVYFYKEKEGKTLEGYDGLYTSNIVLNVMTKTFSEADIKSKNLKEMIKRLTDTKLGVFFIQEASLEETEVIYENQLKVYRGIVPATIYFKED